MDMTDHSALIRSRCKFDSLLIIESVHVLMRICDRLLLAENIVYTFNFQLASTHIQHVAIIFSKSVGINLKKEKSKSCLEK